MGKLFFIKAALILALVSTPIFGMLVEKNLTIDDLLKHDVKKEIITYSYKTGQANLRATCKAYAYKGPAWKFMPDNLEKKYDKKCKQKNKFKTIDKNIILFELVAEQDFDSVQWVLQDGLDHTGILLPPKCTLCPSMIAIHNKNPKMVELLFKSEYFGKKRSWQTYYTKMSVPQIIKECLDTGNNRNFSFLLYLNAVWSDNSDDFKKLYEQTIPTTTGQHLLINECFEENAHYCFAFLLEQKDIQKIIRDNDVNFFKLATNTHKKEIPQILLTKKLFSLNDSISDPSKTILDYYYDETKDAKAIALLVELGAKRWVDLHSAH